MLHGIHVQCAFTDIWGRESWNPISPLSHLIGMFIGSGILLSPTLVVTCSHVVSEMHEDATDPTWAHFRRTSITVNAIPANILSAGNLDGPNPEPDIASFGSKPHCRKRPWPCTVSPPSSTQYLLCFPFIIILVCVFCASSPPQFLCVVPTSSPPHQLHWRGNQPILRRAWTERITRPR
jgi:hypothetical protein